MNPQPDASPRPDGRLLSIDALRGFDMFWIIGGELIVGAWAKASGSGISQFAARQLEHSPWAGLTPYDLIFPTFVFIVGASLVFSLTKQIAVLDETGVILLVNESLQTFAETRPHRGEVPRIGVAVAAAGKPSRAAKPFSWSGWNRVQWHERRKAGWKTLVRAFRSAAR